MKAISIMYHDVVEGGRWDDSGFKGADAALYKLDRERFITHLRALGAKLLEQKPVAVFDLHRGAAGDGRLESRAGAATPVLLTFDDGGVSAHTHIAETLDLYRWPGHFFVTADYVDTPAFLTRAQIRDLHGRGHVIGSHSSSHPQRMARCTRAELLHEWRSSLEVLSDITGEAVRVASVPGGYYARAVAEAAAASGIKYLFTSEPTTRCVEVDGCLVLGRYTVQRRTSAQTVADIASGKLAPRLQQQAIWTAKKVTKAVGGEYYLKARRALIGQG